MRKGKITRGMKRNGSNKRQCSVEKKKIYINTECNYEEGKTGGRNKKRNTKGTERGGKRRKRESQEEMR